MQGDFSRWTFDPRARHRAVLLQQGRVLLDADWNEQGQITAYHDEIRALDFLGRSGCPAESGGFELVGPDGRRPVGTAWEQLAITPGRYYVDGVLAEAHDAGPGEDAPIPLSSLPDGLGPPEPKSPGRYALYLDVWTHHVTRDEEPELREAALGGPDTTTRARTVWWIRTAPLATGAECSDLRDPSWAGAPPGTLTVTLGRAEENPDPCRLSLSGGYTRLENQLYRVQIHDLPTGGAPRYLWSRENGSVTARVEGRTEVTGPLGPETELTLDRVGRDEELSIREGDVVELTSADRQLRGEPGLLATAGSPRGLTLPVKWLAGSPSADLGRAPIVRRWEGAPREIHPNAVELENNIHVAFGVGEFHVGDYWLIPARSVRLVYGIDDEQGTIDWPKDAALPPHGPVHHIAPLAIVGPVVGGGWERLSDCRPLAPPLTGLTTLDLVGGDGQTALAGDELPEEIRVVVRNGGIPVQGAPVRFATESGSIVGGEEGGDRITVRTGPDGVAAVRWTPDGDGRSSHALTARRLDDHGAEIDVSVNVTATVCRPLLRLAGGDGQHLTPGQHLLPEQIQFVVDSPLGPVAGVRVVAEGSTGALVRRGEPGEPRPGSLSGAADSDAALTTDDGRAAFWWLPSFADGASEVLTITTGMYEDEAPLVVTAQRLTGTGRTAGVHIKEVRIAKNVFGNDARISSAQLAQGIEVILDGDVVQNSVRGKPVVRVVLDLPWPWPSENAVWPDQPAIGFLPLELDAEWNADNALINWAATPATKVWLESKLFTGLQKIGWQRPLIGRFVLDGWAIISAQDPALHLNGHVSTFLDRDGRTAFRLPTDDEVTGGQFVQWFRLGK
ncbi:DUF6519 domain-containing protein [Streptomyces scabiei]|uniref:DUF6519 domain-containing protein n=1 Tax=Streptomyces scabiei TaxID=1930 RepID=UPI0038F6DD0A